MAHSNLRGEKEQMKKWKKMLKHAVVWMLVLSMLGDLMVEPMNVNAAALSTTKLLTTENECIYEGDGVLINYSAVNAWEEGYSASIRISNLTETKYENWKIDLITDDVIDEIWKADIISNEEGTYRLAGSVGSQNIEVGGYVEFGFNSSTPFTEFPEIIVHREEEKEIGNGLYEYNYNIASAWISDVGKGFTGSISITNISEEPINEWNLLFSIDNEIDNLWNAEIYSHEANQYAIRGYEYNQNIQPGETREIGFSVNSGAPENIPYDIKVVGRNDSQIVPHLLTSDEYFEDFDNDGVANILEVMLGLDPYDSDTVGNGLSDLEGVNAYLKYTLSGDSDGDGISDYSELEASLNPFKSDSLGDGVLDSERTVSITRKGKTTDTNNIQADVTVELLGSQLDTFVVNKVEDDDLFLNSTIPGYLGNAYDLYVEGGFSNGATLTFTVPDSIMSNSAICPTIYYWNEQTQLLEEVAGQVTIGNKVSVTLEHFSSYMLVDKNAYNRFMSQYKFLAPKVGEEMPNGMDLILVLDESGSIYSTDFSKMKEECSNLVSGLSENDRVAVFTFDSYSRKINTFVSAAQAENYIKRISQHMGLTAIKDAALDGINEKITNGREDSTSVLILLTDGYSNADSTLLSYKDIAKKAKDNDIQIYTIGVGNSLSVTDLTTLAEETGGRYYPISNFSKLQEAFGKIIDDADIYTDSDEDGLSNYYEKRIAQSQIRLGTGATIPNVAQLDYENPDSDGDGLLDGEELLIQEREGGIYGYIVSFPTEKNSDGDKFDDYAEYMIGTDATKFRSFDDEEIDINQEEVIVYTSYEQEVSEEDVSASGADILGHHIRGIWIGTWREMAGDHDWGFIHRLVQKKIIEQNPGRFRSEVSIPGGRLDVVDTRNNIFWEVKAISYYTNPEKAVLLEGTIARYESNSIYHKGGIGSFFPYLKWEEAGYEIEYICVGDGKVFYSFYRKRTETDPVKLPVESEEPSKEPAEYKFKLPIKETIYTFTVLEMTTIEYIKRNSVQLSLGERQLEAIREIFGIEGVTVVAVVMVGALFYLVANDGTIIGFADDFLIVPVVIALIKTWKFIVEDGKYKLVE